MCLFQSVDDGGGIKSESGNGFDKGLENVVNPCGGWSSDATVAGDNGATCECVFMYLGEVVELGNLSCLWCDLLCEECEYLFVYNFRLESRGEEREEAVIYLLCWDGWSDGICASV